MGIYENKNDRIIGFPTFLNLPIISMTKLKHLPFLFRLFPAILSRNKNTNTFRTNTIQDREVTKIKCN